MLRTILSLALLLGLAGSTGCSKDVTRENAQADTHVDTKPGLFEVKQSAQKLKEKLANYRFPDDAVQKYGTPMPVALYRFKNDTHEHFDTELFTDEMRDILTETGKVAFQIVADRVGEAQAQDTYEKNFNSTDPNQQITENAAAGTRYAMYGRLAAIPKTDRSKGVDENTMVVTMEMLDKQKKLTVLIAKTEFRLRKE
jgi:PBP1b-binding outer membrane lipoprotein LpoB